MTEDELFLTAILDCKRSDLYLRPLSLDDTQKKRLEDMRARRRCKEPVQYIVGFTEFFGYRFDVGPGVLIPRPETEVLADVLVKALEVQGKPDCLVLDVGTGSGCLAVTLARELPHCRVVALEVSSVAMEYARHNAALNGVQGRIDFLEQDARDFMQATRLRFDAVVANPPYIPTADLVNLPEDVRHEPVRALDGGMDGLDDYRYIIPASGCVLDAGGFLAVEHGDGQSKELQNLFASAGCWDKIQSFRDNAGLDRVIMAQRSH